MQDSRELADLVPAMRAPAEALLERLEARGEKYVVASTLRDLERQAVLFRMGRAYSDIVRKMGSLRARGFGFLADVLEAVGPQPGKLGAVVTYAAPGESWHNFGEAIDAYPLEGGKLAPGHSPRWQLYGADVEAVGLKWAGRWPKFTEFPHAQLREGGSPLRVLSPSEVRAALERWL